MATLLGFLQFESSDSNVILIGDPDTLQACLSKLEHNIVVIGVSFT